MDNQNPSPLEKSIKTVAKQCNCSVEAVVFIARTPLETNAEPPISCAQFCWMVHDNAMLEFADQAQATLERWGIRSTADIGSVLFALADQGLARLDEKDQLEDFTDVFQFVGAFQNFRDPEYARSLRTKQHRANRWSMKTLLLILVSVAIALAGSQTYGVRGALLTLFGIWFLVAGTYCIFLALREKGSIQIAILVTGIIFFCSGALALASISFAGL